MKEKKYITRRFTLEIKRKKVYLNSPSWESCFKHGLKIGKLGNKTAPYMLDVLNNLRLGLKNC